MLLLYVIVLYQLHGLSNILFLSRDVYLPQKLVKYVPDILMTKEKWRSIGIKQSSDWEHYQINDGII